MPTESEPESAQPKKLPHVTESYRKAHKNYALVSGLLISWGLTDVKLDLGEKWGIKFSSPNAIPLIFLTLVFYWAYKITIEWMQCEPARQKNKIARLDYIVAHFIATIAVGIILIQYFGKIHVMQVLANNVTIILAFALSVLNMLMTLVFVSVWKDIMWPLRTGFSTAMLIAWMTPVVFISKSGIHLGYLSMAIGILFACLLQWSTRMLLAKVP